MGAEMPLECTCLRMWEDGEGVGRRVVGGERGGRPYVDDEGTRRKEESDLYTDRISYRPVKRL